ncbi:hypothetical protein EQ827_01125 [Lactobacillus bombi]|nr:hypothetical protein [Bombilactobacillus bombi]
MVLTYSGGLDTSVEIAWLKNEGYDVLACYIDAGKGNVICEGRQSPNSLYDEKLATYTAADEFDQEAAAGFIKLYGLPTQVYAQVHQKLAGNNHVDK